MTNWESIVYFMAWLTSREKVSGPFSSKHECGEAADLLEEFRALEKWDGDELVKADIPRE